jgi:oxalate decarboxylase/phosphoglucose isomerase-like protein (cupin superfamily)
MGLSKGISIRQLESIQGGMAQFYTPQSSNETMLVQIPAGSIDDLFVHRNQTDQILVVKGNFVLVVLQNRQYQYIPLSDRLPQVVIIPPGVLHGAINLNSEPCLLVNAVLRHGPANERDYLPRERPFPYDLESVKAVLKRHYLVTSNW